MVSALSPEDLELDARWRARFGQPLPILGARELVEIMLALPLEDAPPARRAVGNVIEGPWPGVKLRAAP